MGDGCMMQGAFVRRTWAVAVLARPAMTSRSIDSGRDGAMASKVTLGCFARMRELHQWAHLNCFLVFQQPFQQTTLIFVFNGSFFHGSLFNGSFFQGSHKGASNQDRANSQARCERGPGGRARVTIFARTESEVKQRPLIFRSMRRGEWRGAHAPALLSPRGSPW